MGGHQRRKRETGVVVLVRGLLRGSSERPESVELGLGQEVRDGRVMAVLFGGPSSTSAHSAGVGAKGDRGAD